MICHCDEVSSRYLITMRYHLTPVRISIINNAAMNIGALMLFRISVLGSFGYIPISGVAGSKSRTTLNFLRYLHTAFHSGCINLLSH